MDDVFEMYDKFARGIPPRADASASCDAGPAEPVHTVEWWLNRSLDRPEPLLGEVVTNTSRIFLGGPTESAT